MLHCNYIFRYKNYCILLLLFFAAEAAPQISMPSMPSVSAPSITSPSRPQITNTGNTQSDKNTTSSKTSEAESLSTALTASSLSSINSLLSDGTLSSLIGEETGSTSLTSLLSLSSLVSGKTDINSLLDQTASGTAASAAGSGTSLIVLNKILEQLTKINGELELLKKENTALSEKLASSSSSAAFIDKTNSVSDNPDATKESLLLRFTVNGYNVLETCKTLYFSTPDKDGSFLCTGDREYTANGTLRKETFYMLFTSSGKNTYEVAVRVLQDYLNEYSFVYQLAMKENLQAVKKGNLIYLIVDETLWKLDFLISLGS